MQWCKPAWRLTDLVRLMMTKSTASLMHMLKGILLEHIPLPHAHLLKRIRSLSQKMVSCADTFRKLPVSNPQTTE